MINATFPAVLIGGPPQSGKSVLVYSLTQALRQAGVPHYALRACPDGEGDWSNEVDQKLVRIIRAKGQFNDTFVQRVAGYLQNRHMPLLVDVGGKPTPTQEQLFAHCTQAILLIGHREDDPAAFARDLATWRQMMWRQGVPIVAEIKSRLVGEGGVDEGGPILQGTLTGLVREQTARGPAFAALVEQLRALFPFTEEGLARLHLVQAPVELTLDLPALARTWGVPTRTSGGDDELWLPSHLPRLQAYLPWGKPLAVYGRAPIWLYAMLSMVAYPAPFWQYDARFGWVQPPLLVSPTAAPEGAWQVAAEETADYTWLHINIYSQYLEMEEVEGLWLPPMSPEKGVIIEGKIPFWLATAVTRQLARQHPWTAVYQPQLSAAAVVYSQDGAYPVGRVVR